MGVNLGPDALARFSLPAQFCFSCHSEPFFCKGSPGMRRTNLLHRGSPAQNSWCKSPETASKPDTIRESFAKRRLRMTVVRDVEAKNCYALTTANVGEHSAIGRPHEQR